MNMFGLSVDVIMALAVLLPIVTGSLATLYVGYVNIALDSLILLGAFSYIAFGSVFGAVLGFIFAILTTAMIAVFADLFSQKTGADSFVVGLAVNLFIPACISIVSQIVFNTKGVVMIDYLVSNKLLFLHASDYFAFFVTFVFAIIILFTPFGNRAIAAGSNKSSLIIAGIKPEGVRALSYLLSGLGCGVGGATLAASLGGWVPNMSAGRGWIALVIMYLGGKSFGGSILAAAAFSILLGVTSRAQSFLPVPTEILMSIPYFVTTIVIIVGNKKK